MKTLKFISLIALLTLSGCFDEDLGPQQQDKRTYTVYDFDRIEVSNALIVTVVYAQDFSITAEGDRRNLDDLLIYKNGNTLVARFRDIDQRQYSTYITITLPALYAIDFSGAAQGTVSGFDAVPRFDISLTGASYVQLNQSAQEMHVTLSGASQLLLRGTGDLLEGTVSGASTLTAFQFLAKRTALMISGASHSEASVAEELNITISGASVMVYRGEPELIINSSGSSIVRKD